MRWKWKPPEERKRAWFNTVKQWHPYRPILHTVYLPDAGMRVWGERVFRRWKNQNTYLHEIPSKPWSWRVQRRMRKNHKWEYCAFPLIVSKEQKEAA